MANARTDGKGGYVLSTSTWPAERWSAVIVLGALALLVLIRMGFRGVNVLGASVNLK